VIKYGDIIIVVHSKTTSTSTALRQLIDNIDGGTISFIHACSGGSIMGVINAAS
jgi:hypothetical protein